VFARRLLEEWQRRGWRLSGGGVVVAVSGGADSTALLLALAELLKAGRLRFEMTVAHLNHGLRGEAAEADALWVAGLAREHGYAAVVGRARVEEDAREARDNLEQAARRARYRFLLKTARGAGAWAVVAAHTLDDQAETVLLRLLRGSGAEGLGGMRPARVLEAEGSRDGEAISSREGEEILLLRPLLGWARRADAEAYCRARGVEFRSDAMNEDERFARVRVRRRLLPLLETFNPRVAEALARTAELLSDDAQALEREASKLLEEARVESPEGAENGAARPLRVEVLREAQAALRRRALRQWITLGRGGLRRIEMIHILAVERLLQGIRGGRVAELPDGSSVERRGGWLRFREKS
jgi:tRNA(Ile)-lysidine synthase